MSGHATSLLSRFPDVARRKLTVIDYHRMGEAGILTRDERVELIDGELVAMAPIGSEHAATVSVLTRMLVLAIGEQAVVSPQTAIRLGERSEPQPDFAILKPRDDYYRPALPTAPDVLLLIEVSDTTLMFDRGAKLALYARHGIPEVWIVDNTGATVEVHKSPEGERYGSVQILGRGDALTIGALPEANLPVASIFGQAHSARG